MLILTLRTLTASSQTSMPRELKTSTHPRYWKKDYFNISKKVLEIILIKYYDTSTRAINFWLLLSYKEITREMCLLQ